MKLIDGSKLIDNLSLILQCWSVSPFVSKEKHNGAVDMLREVEREVKEAPTLTPPNEWVSVKDDTPAPGERVIATDGGFVGEGYISCYGKWCRPNGMLWSVFKTEVSKWMPLPAPHDKYNNVPTDEPLTIEQLREMDAPVWCSCKTIEGWDGYWCLCQRGHIITPSGNAFDVKEIQDWVFYSFPPEGEDA